MTRQPEPALRPLLAGRDVLCPHCEHNLRDSAGTSCPECGEILTVFEIRRGQLMPASPIMRACAFGLATWITLTVLALMVASITLRTGSPERLPTLAGIVALLAWEVWITRRFTRRPRALLGFSRAARVFLWFVLCAPVVGLVVGIVALFAWYP